MEYKVITKDIIKIKGNNALVSTYIYAITKYYEDFKSHISTVTEDTISKLSETPLKTIEKIIPKIKVLPYLYKDVYTKLVDKEKKRNYYQFADKFDNYFYIDNKFYKTPLKGIQEQSLYKGFLLRLKSVCLNNTNRYWNGNKLNKSKLANDLGLSRPTLNKYLDTLLETDNLRLLDDGSLFINNKYIYPDFVSNDVDTFHYHTIYNYCLDNNVTPPDRDEKALRSLETAFFKTEYTEETKQYYLPYMLETRCKNLPEKVNFAYFIKALMNNDTMLKGRPKTKFTIILD